MQKNNPQNFVKINSGGIERTVTLYIPSSVDITSGSHPAVIAFHGAGGAGYAFQISRDFDSVADSLGYIMVYPSSKHDIWVEEVADSLYDVTVNDHQFASDIVNYLVDSLNVREDGIFAAGYSSGGIFLHSLVNNIRNKITAYAAYGATMSNIMYNTDIPNRTPAILMHGTEDLVIPWEGEQVGWFYDMSQNDCLEKVLFHNDCIHGDSTVTRIPDLIHDDKSVRKEVYRNSEGEICVEYYAIIGGSHAWYYGDITPEKEILDFFEMILKRK